MDITFSKLFKIDLSQKMAGEKPDYLNNANFKKYITELLLQIGEKEPERSYKFMSEFTEVRGLITKILMEKEYNVSCQSIANRLLKKEIDAQDDLDKKKLGIEIQKGMLIISLIRMTSEDLKLIMCKVDYDEFISEITGEIESGLSLRKKVYKAFVSDLNNQLEISKILIFDSNKRTSAYWWDKFLELDVVTTNEENTIRAFDAIETTILKPLQQKYKADYFHLWNSTIRYFRANEEFSIEDYITNGIGEYLPFDEKLNMETLKTKIRELPKTSKDPFDGRFEIVKKKITKRLRNTIKLTDQIDLHLKQDIPNESKTIIPWLRPDGTKFVMIKSPEGYEYFLRKSPNE
jgi:hypothetical protein